MNILSCEYLLSFSSVLNSVSFPYTLWDFIRFEPLLKLTLSWFWDGFCSSEILLIEFLGSVVLSFLADVKVLRVLDDYGGNSEL